VPIISEDWYAEVIHALNADVQQPAFELRQEIHLPDDIAPIQSGSPAAHYLSKRGFGRFEINEYRLVEQPDRYRIVIPSYRDNLIDFWVSRTYINESPKYLNPKGASRRFALFGYDQAKGASRVVICEGVFSAMAARQATEIPAVAAYGKLVAAEQVKILLSLRPKEFIIAFDSDADSEAMMLALVADAPQYNWHQKVLRNLA